MPIRSIRRKILVSLLATTLCFGLVMVVFAETVIRRTLTDKLQQKGVVIARKVASDCVSPIITARYFEVTMQLKDLLGADKDFIYAFVLGEDGRALAHTFPGGLPAGLGRAHPVAPLQPFSVLELNTDRGHVFDLAVPLLRGQAGVLHLGLSGVSIDRDVNTIVLLVLLAAAVAMLLGGVAAIAFSRIITRPLLQLTESAEAFGRGDANYVIAVESHDEVGALAHVFNAMIEKRRRAEQEREQLIGDLRKTLSEVKTLRGFLPICSSCKRIRDDQGYWQQIESYIRDHSEAEFSHGLCQECAKTLYPEYMERIQKKAEA